MTTYYRFTNQASPMSDWGHAMFAEDMDAVSHYGDKMYTLDGSHAVSIFDLEAAIKDAWESNPCSEYAHLTADEAFDQFCPDEIVNSAAAYDTEMVCWLWDAVLDGQGIMVVRTTNGAVCFDESLINEVTQ